MRTTRLHWPTMLSTIGFLTALCSVCFLIWPEQFFFSPRYAVLRSVFSPYVWGILGVILSLCCMVPKMPSWATAYVVFPAMTLYWIILGTNYLIGGAITPMAVVAGGLSVLTAVAYYLAGGFRAKRPI